MKRSLVVMLFLGAWATYALAAPRMSYTGNQALPGSENKAMTIPPPSQPGGTLVWGEDVAHAFPILGLPFSDNGNTCGFRRGCWKRGYGPL